MTDQRGLALLEVILIGLLVFAPVIWAIGVLADVHRSALAATDAVREAAFEGGRSSGLLDAGRSVDGAVRQAFADEGLDPRRAKVEWAGSPGFRRGGSIEVRVAYPVTVLQAPLIGRVSGPSIWVRATTVARIDPYRSR
jgi:hypothetical protein